MVWPSCFCWVCFDQIQTLNFSMIHANGPFNSLGWFLSIFLTIIQFSHTRSICYRHKRLTCSCKFFWPQLGFLVKFQFHFLLLFFLQFPFSQHSWQFQDYMHLIALLMALDRLHPAILLQHVACNFWTTSQLPRMYVR